ncbi:hypothetical protein MXB_4849 [Myxobolus squamalis]|nr:hypothetical protein MXB_4849 [Myxobolus squamalis]
MSIKKKALITGITGQDGSYLLEFLLNKNYEVHGIMRRSSSFNTGRIIHLYSDKGNFKSQNIHLHYGDLTDMSSLCHIVSTVEPDEIYNLAAQSHVKTSFELPEYTSDVAGMGFVRILEAVRSSKLTHKVKIYQASTSEMFGDFPVHPQNENTPLQPCSPYGLIHYMVTLGAAKVYAHHIAKIYREGFGMFIASGILFNHESPRRGSLIINYVLKNNTRSRPDPPRDFYTCKDLLLIKISLGNLDSYRDWGHARDYVEAMWRILQQNIPEDFVIATGRSITVREFVNMCFKHINLDITWKGEGLSEIGVDQNEITRIIVDQKYFRAKEVDYLQGDASKARSILKWEPKTSLELVV